MRRVSIEERRARLGIKHNLARRAKSVEESLAGIAAYHSSDPATVYLSARARVDGFEVAHLERALYDDRTLLRLLGMRSTLWVVPRDMGPPINESSTVDISAAQRRVNIKMIEKAGVAEDGASWLDRVSAETLAALDRLGESRAVELSALLPDLATKIDVHSRTGTFQATVGVSTRVLFQLASEGRVIRTRPAGSWVSGQYRWTTMRDWLGEDLPRLDPADARARVLESYLRGFGPVTEQDMRWWTGWTKSRTFHALDRIGASEVELEGVPAWMLDDDSGGATSPWVALLPSLDPTTMGWKGRDWYLGDHAGLLFDRNGNAGPTVWVDGRVVGGWAVDRAGNVAWKLLEDPGSEATARIEEEAGRVQAWLAGRIITPRFRSPLERELAG
jgi:hypothetical protein